jgi:hypothetical protein
MELVSHANITRRGNKMLDNILLIVKWLVKGFISLLAIDVAIFATIELIKTICRHRNNGDKS